MIKINRAYVQVNVKGSGKSASWAMYYALYPNVAPICERSGKYDCKAAEVPGAIVTECVGALRSRYESESYRIDFVFRDEAVMKAAKKMGGEMEEVQLVYAYHNPGEEHGKTEGIEEQTESA